MVQRLGRELVPTVAIVLVCVALWPPAESPFHAPKWIVVWGAAGASLALLPWTARVIPEQRWLYWSIAAWTSTVVVTAIAAPIEGTAWWSLAAPVLVLGWALSGASSRAGVLVAGAVVSLVVLLQASGFDPFSSFGPSLHGARIARYGSLGNPDFVASVLGVLLPLTVAARSRFAWGVAVLEVLALAVTQSFASIACLAAAGLAALLHLRSLALTRPSATRSPRGEGIGVAMALAVMALPLAGRSLTSTAAGRLYLWKLTAPHALDAPLTGLGHGSFAARWPQWELDVWKARCGDDAACVAAHPDAPFTGLQDHAHNDWLERLIETGVPGTLALLAVFASSFVLAFRARGRMATATCASIAALAMRATIDFPLARPADVCLLALLAGTASVLGAEQGGDP